MFDKLAESKTWEVGVTKVIRDHLKPGGSFVDVGAGLGYYTLLASRLLGYTGRVLSFEPHPENYRCIMLALAEIDAANVSAYAVALGEKLEATCLRSNPVNEGTSRIGVLGDKSWRGFSCMVVPLDALSAELPSPVVMKVDVEGVEPAVLLGAREFIKRYRPFIVAENNTWIYRDALTAGLVALDYSVAPLGDLDVMATPR
jgi:FkbM family methyltransferase